MSNTGSGCPKELLPTCAFAKAVDFGFLWTSRISLRLFTTMTVADGLGTTGTDFPCVELDIVCVVRSFGRWCADKTMLGLRVFTTGPRMRPSRRAIMVMVGKNRGLCLTPHLRSGTG